MRYRIIRQTRESEQELRSAGYASVCHVPFLLGEDGSYPALINRYLRARALGEWPPSPQGKLKRRNFLALTKSSLESVAYWLNQFLGWVSDSDGKIDPITLTYEELLTWQVDLKRKGVKDSSIRLYVTEACLYLTWLGQVPANEDGTPVRTPFDAEYREVDQRRSRERGGKKNEGGAALVGLVRAKPPPIELPSDRAITKWLKRMRFRSEVKALMAEVILDTGLRISEINLLQESDLPEPTEWRAIGGRIHFRVERGVKGPKLTPSSEISLDGREISMSLGVAERVHRYRSNARALQVRRWIRAASTPAERARRSANRPTRMWLSDFTNKPFTNVSVRDVWRDEWAAIRKEFPGEPRAWSPQKGRHWFAVERLLDAADSQFRAVGSGVPNLTWLEGVMRNQIDLLIRPLLGHASEETTRLYLRAALRKIEERFGSSSLRWQEFMDEEP